MAKYIVETIVSEVVAREVEVDDDFPGDKEREAKFRAWSGGGNVIDDHPAAGTVQHLAWEDWDCAEVDDDEETE